MKRPPDEVLRTWHRIVAVRGGEVGVEVVNGKVDPCPAQRVRSAGLTRWVGGLLLTSSRLAGYFM